MPRKFTLKVYEFRATGDNQGYPQYLVRTDTEGKKTILALGGLAEAKLLKKEAKDFAGVESSDIWVYISNKAPELSTTNFPKPGHFQFEACDWPNLSLVKRLPDESLAPNCDEETEDDSTPSVTSRSKQDVYKEMSGHYAALSELMTELSLKE
eukprot:TRINITY_DN9144_c0_g1_i1.p1 TRINITY_DN9144_c0_g1~~TRINITY_DN9144_c0_g1_i1.p1  ORF type:complete len:167 (+),score=18.91 TRINITY_DN9144_c0_g1_i1:44-502(+)